MYKCIKAGSFLNCLKTGDIVPGYQAKGPFNKTNHFFLFYFFFYMVFGGLIAHSILFLDCCNPAITNLVVVGMLKQYLGTFRKLMTAYQTTY